MTTMIEPSSNTVAGTLTHTIQQTDCTVSEPRIVSSLTNSLSRYPAGFHVLTKALQDGSTAVVYAGYNPQTNQRVAVKQLSIAGHTAETLATAMRREITAHLKLDGHVNVGRFLGVELPCVNSRQTSGISNPALIFELYEHGDLLEHIPVHRGLHESTAVIAISGVCEALVHMHNKGIVHRDIKSENVCVGNDGFVKVIDFGSCLFLDNEERIHVMTEDDFMVGSIPYLAPEFYTMARQSKCNLMAVDAWALGIFIYSVLTGAFPFTEANSNCDEFLRYTKCSVADSEFASSTGFGAVNYWSVLSTRMSQIVSGLLCIDPTQRMSVSEARSLLQ
ncbi:serine/threonine protein kinase [Sphaeroforma arctica JP610]|uniref:Serine/threonine protein kinase n=1 Tax=Sphaeroforma arctica JP610 TaxID=667725 RepID=A0A0L0G6Q4_9EUKA|nr:serine/threonine protein kinase [Sphaeroforma arctica JP610]KNC84599.1 serine/threonine protein kinase [Sphaeroforma arctica JP610]|eukprot:XP_014158501.1 serine/threonine protein kinase [Sphaeroforma arctica JP610]